MMARACTCADDACSGHLDRACPRAAAIEVAVSATPTASAGELVRFGVCWPCYLWTWREADLTGTAWELSCRSTGVDAAS